MNGLLDHPGRRYFKVPTVILLVDKSIAYSKKLLTLAPEQQDHQPEKESTQNDQDGISLIGTLPPTRTSFNDFRWLA